MYSQYQQKHTVTPGLNTCTVNTNRNKSTFTVSTGLYSRRKYQQNPHLPRHYSVFPLILLSVHPDSKSLKSPVVSCFLSLSGPGSRGAGLQREGVDAEHQRAAAETGGPRQKLQLYRLPVTTTTHKHTRCAFLFCISRLEKETEMVCGFLSVLKEDADIICLNKQLSSNHNPGVDQLKRD